jgi:hypothetical protein
MRIICSTFKALVAGHNAIYRLHTPDESHPA